MKRFAGGKSLYTSEKRYVESMHSLEMAPNYGLTFIMSDGNEAREYDCQGTFPQDRGRTSSGEIRIHPISKYDN